MKPEPKKKPRRTPKATERKIAYKVLVRGASCHGGSLAWSLPVEKKARWTPGEWHEVTGAIAVCSNGLHLTEKPINWWLTDADVYEAEYEGETDRESERDDKFAVRRCRLLRKLDWEQFDVYTTGEHTIAAGKAAIACGNSTVTAWGNSTVTAWDNSTVTARDNSTVTAWGNSTVTARDNSTVTARGNSTVTAWGNSTVIARDNSTVTAWGNSTVTAWGNSNAIRSRWHSGGWVKLHELAAVIDRRTGTPQYFAAPYSDAPATEAGR